MENKNFMALTEDELYDVNGGASVGDYCSAGATVAVGTIFGLCGTGIGIAGALMLALLPLAEPANPQPGDKVVAGGYHFVRTESGSLMPDPDLVNKKDKSSSSKSSSSSSSKSSGKSSK